MPRWLVVTAVVLAFLALVAAAVLKAVLEEPPEHARLPALQERFGEQIAALAEAARTFPLEACPDPGSPRDLVRDIDRLGGWQKEAGSAWQVFDHPALLGAEIVFECGPASTLTFDVKRFDNPDGAWSGALLLPPDEYPAVTVWHDGRRTLIRYEDKLTPSPGTPRTIRLTFDPESLEPG